MTFCTPTPIDFNTHYRLIVKDEIKGRFIRKGIRYLRVETLRVETGIFEFTYLPVKNIMVVDRLAAVALEHIPPELDNKSIREPVVCQWTRKIEDFYTGEFHTFEKGTIIFKESSAYQHRPARIGINPMHAEDWLKTKPFK